MFEKFNYEVKSGIEDELFGVLLGLWVSFLTIELSIEDNPELHLVLPPGYLLYLVVMLGAILGLLKVGQSKRIKDRALFYLYGVLTGFFGMSGLKGLNQQLDGWLPYFGLFILGIWILTTEITSLAMNRNGTINKEKSNTREADHINQAVQQEILE